MITRLNREMISIANDLIWQLKPASGRNLVLKPWKMPRTPLQRVRRPQSDPSNNNMDNHDQGAQSRDVEEQVTVTLWEYKAQRHTTLVAPTWKPTKSYLCSCCSNAWSHPYKLAQHWRGCWGNRIASCPMNQEWPQPIAQICDDMELDTRHCLFLRRITIC